MLLRLLRQSFMAHKAAEDPNPLGLEMPLTAQ